MEGTPTTFAVEERDGRVLLARPEDMDRLAAVLAAPEGKTERGTVRFVELGGANAGLYAVRRYHRGGALARLLGDLQLGAGRAQAELAAYAEARARGVPTLTAVGAAATAVAPFVTRLDLVTVAVPRAKSLAGLYRDGLAQASPHARRAVLRAAGEAVRRAFEGGLTHPDLNMANLLVADADPQDEALARWERGEAPTVLVIDLDGATVSPEPLSARRRHAQLGRLFRSFLKLGPRLACPADRRDGLRLAEAAVGNDRAALRDALRALRRLEPWLRLRLRVRGHGGAT